MVRTNNFEVDWQQQQMVDDFLRKHPKAIGIDEVGRGALAGPIIVAGVGFKSPLSHFLITDSKLLSRHERYKAAKIINSVLSYSHFEEITADVINQNKVNLNVLIKEAIVKILDDAATKGITGALIDWIEVKHPVVETLSLPKMELICCYTAAASILAKIKRDKIMKNYGQKYPNFVFPKNSGYGTKDHIAAIKKHGLCPIHRVFFSNKFLSRLGKEG